MKTSQLLEGQWLEYSGGSRPGTNMIRFLELDKENVLIELWYVFDWDTGETGSHGFRITRREFDQLVNRLLQEGYASLSKVTEGQRLDFEWKTTNKGFAFRLAGHNTGVFQSSGGLEIKEFKDVACGQLIGP
jgi:hypothetical protein